MKGGRSRKEPWSWEILVEQPGPQSLPSKGTQLPGRQAESLAHPVILPTEPLLHSEGDKVERKGMTLRARSQGVHHSQAGPDKPEDGKNLDTAPLKTFPDPRGGRGAALGTEAGALFRRFGIRM